MLSNDLEVKIISGPRTVISLDSLLDVRARVATPKPERPQLPPRLWAVTFCAEISLCRSAAGACAILMCFKQKADEPIFVPFQNG